MTGSVVPSEHGLWLASTEQGLIGALLSHRGLLDVLPELSPLDFHDSRAGWVWSACVDLYGESAPIDLHAVEAILARSGRLDAVGPIYLGEAILRCPTEESAQHYAETIRDESLKRRARIALSGLLESTQGDSGTGSELVSEALRVVTGLDRSITSEAGAPIGEMVRDRLAQLSETSTSDLTGVPTGVAGLDQVIGGWQRGIVSIVAARPGHGKSSLGLSTTDACSQAGIGVHVFSLEDTRDSYCDRVVARASQVSAESLRRRELTRGEMDEVKAGVSSLRRRSGWYVDDRSGIGADEIVRSVRRQRKANNTQVVIVDYLQLIKRNRDAQSVHESIGMNLNILADAAKQDAMAYIVMSQLNRGVESREDKRPSISDMRESGTIEERAKCVIGLYRGAAYGPAKVGVDCHENGNVFRPDEHEHKIQLMVLKNSNGKSPARVIANWHGPTTRIW